MTLFPFQEGVGIATDVKDRWLGSQIRQKLCRPFGTDETVYVTLGIIQVTEIPRVDGAGVHTSRRNSIVHAVRTEVAFVDGAVGGCREVPLAFLVVKIVEIAGLIRTSAHTMPAADTFRFIDGDKAVIAPIGGTGRADPFARWLLAMVT
jgi:hypothetical protein